MGPAQGARRTAMARTRRAGRPPWRRTV